LPARRAFGAFVGAALLLAIGAGQATAATKTVYAGPNAKLPGDLVFNDFYGKKVTIHQGDSVRWVFRGFHDVVFPAKGKKPPGFIVPDAAAKIAGVNDAAGNPFWFNGQPRFQVDPQTAFPAGGKTYDGSKLAGSGAPLGPVKPYKLKFTKKGTFTYYCTIHPGMKGQVKVVARSARIPSAAQDAKAAQKQLVAQEKTAKKLADPTIPAATVHGGSDKGAVNQLKFFPSTVTIKAGQAVAFEVPGGQEPHTFSFGTPDYLRAVVANQIAPLPGSGNPPLLVFDPRVLYPSDAPLPAYDGTNHGNGFISTGALGEGLPAKKSSITFSKPGTYDFVCLIHPEMQGKVVVQ
jgi:plastocyanin